MPSCWVGRYFSPPKYPKANEVSSYILKRKSRIYNISAKILQKGTLLKHLQNFIYPKIAFTNWGIYKSKKLFATIFLKLTHQQNKN